MATTIAGFKDAGTVRPTKEPTGITRTMTTTSKAGNSTMDTGITKTMMPTPKTTAMARTIATKATTTSLSLTTGQHIDFVPHSFVFFANGAWLALLGLNPDSRPSHSSRLRFM